MIDIRTDALAGPWQAVLAERHGYIVTIDEVRAEEIDPDDIQIVVVRLSAAPAESDDDERLPGSWASTDRIAEWDDFEEPKEVEVRWIQAQAMAAGLNSALAGA